MDGFMYILPAILIVAMVIFLVFKLKGNGSSSATPDRVAAAVPIIADPRRMSLFKILAQKSLMLLSM